MLGNGDNSPNPTTCAKQGLDDVTIDSTGGTSGGLAGASTSRQIIT